MWNVSSWLVHFSFENVYNMTFKYYCLDFMRLLKVFYCFYSKNTVDIFTYPHQLLIRIPLYAEESRRLWMEAFLLQFIYFARIPWKIVICIIRLKREETHFQRSIFILSSILFLFHLNENFIFTNLSFRIFIVLTFKLL